MNPEQEAAFERFSKRETRTGENISWGDTVGGLAISRLYLPELSQGIQERLEDPKASDANLMRRTLPSLLKVLDPEIVALATMSNALHSLISNKELVATAVTVGTAIEEEVWAAGLSKHDAELFQRVDRWARRRSNIQGRVAAARSAAKRAGFNLSRWSREHRVQVGMWLLGVLVDTLPDVFTVNDEGTHLRVTEGAMELAEDAFEQAVRMHPVFLPRAEPPLPWTSWRRSGPADTLMRARHRETVASVKQAIEDGSIRPTLDALNAIQNVAWTINQPVLDVMLKCHQRGIVIKGGAKGWGVPPTKDLPLPAPCPHWDAMTSLEQDQWRLEAARVRRTNDTIRGERLSFTEDAETAKELATFGRFYVPHGLDWRGRVYGLSHFNFQRGDRVRALFLFADGEPIGEEGLYWLKIHVANCGDFDKISKRPFEERVKWTEDNAAVIAAIAENPLAAKQLAVWTTADKPFLFLAACLELVGALTTGASYVTRLPVSWDGSCSGLQHLCAMTRAPEGSLVNLTPLEEPQDVYTLVADAAFQAMEADIDDEDEDKRRYARMALAYDGNRRKLVKRNVMTYSYSSKKFGMRQQHVEDLMEPLTVEVQQGKRAEHPFTDNEQTQRGVATYLATKVYAAIETVVDRPARAMAFLQKIARALAHEGKPVSWTTPTGLPWCNRYHQSLTKRVRLWMHDRSVRITVASGYAKEIDKDKSANGIAPNLVHACDAAHLMMVVNAAVQEGITSHALVHDSFGCLASRAGRYHQIIREQFVRLYQEHDVLAEVLERAKCDLSDHNQDRLPNMVEPGTLNLEDVLHAQYAFA